MRPKFFLKNLLIFLVPLLIPILILGTLAIVITEQKIQSDISRSNHALFQQIDRSIDLVFKEMDSLSISFGNPEVVFRLEEILRTQTLTLENLRLIENTKNYINAPANSRPYIESIYVYIENRHGQFLSSVQGLTRFDRFYDSEWLDSFDPESKQRNVWTESREIRRYSFEEPTPVTTMYKNLYSNVSDRPQGLIVLNIYTEYIEQMLQEASTYPDQDILVIDEQGEVIFSTRTAANIDKADLEQVMQEGTAYTLEIEDQSYVVSYHESDHYGWRYISLVPTESLSVVSTQLSGVIVFIVFIAAVLGIAMTYFVTRRYVNHIRMIISMIKSAESHQLHPAYSARMKQSDDEYGFILRRILQNYIDQKNLQIEVSENRYKLKETELIALQNQINPHFLFNTMETINWKVLSFTGRPNEANQMIEHLSEILKYALDTSLKVVPLGKEMEMTRHYVAIQKIRYRNKFEVIYDYDPSHLRFGTIKFVLQPLIENSIYHGIKEKSGMCGIKIKVIRHADKLELCVIDNGRGMSPAKLREVRKTLRDEYGQEEESRVIGRSTGSNIGLSNIYNRLRLTYGQKDLMSIRSKEGLGTVVRVYIPTGN